MVVTPRPYATLASIGYSAAAHAYSRRAQEYADLFGVITATAEPDRDLKDLIAGWMVIDVDTYERALALASELSAAPAPAARRSTSGSGAPVPQRTPDGHRVTARLGHVGGWTSRCCGELSRAREKGIEGRPTEARIWPSTEPLGPAATSSG